MQSRPSPGLERACARHANRPAASDRRHDVPANSAREAQATRRVRGLHCDRAAANRETAGSRWVAKGSAVTDEQGRFSIRIPPHRGAYRVAVHSSFVGEHVPSRNIEENVAPRVIARVMKRLGLTALCVCARCTRRLAPRLGSDRRARVVSGAPGRLGLGARSTLGFYLYLDSAPSIASPKATSGRSSPGIATAMSSPARPFNRGPSPRPGLSASRASIDTIGPAMRYVGPSSACTCRCPRSRNTRRRSRLRSRSARRSRSTSSSATVRPLDARHSRYVEGNLSPRLPAGKQGRYPRDRNRQVRALSEVTEDFLGDASLGVSGPS